MEGRKAALALLGDSPVINALSSTNEPCEKEPGTPRWALGEEGSPEWDDKSGGLGASAGGFSDQIDRTSASKDGAGTEEGSVGAWMSGWWRRRDERERASSKQAGLQPARTEAMIKSPGKRKENSQRPD